MIGGIVLLLLSNSVDFFYSTMANCYQDGVYLVCTGIKPNYDAPIDGTPFVLIGIVGVILFALVILIRSRIRPSTLRNVSVCCYLWAVIPLFMPALLVAFSYAAGPGFLFYLLSLLPIISSLILFKGILPHKSSTTKPIGSFKTYNSQQSLPVKTTSSIITCRSCGAINKTEDKFCGICGHPLH